MDSRTKPALIKVAQVLFAGAAVGVLVLIFVALRIGDDEHGFLIGDLAMTWRSGIPLLLLTAVAWGVAAVGLWFGANWGRYFAVFQVIVSAPVILFITSFVGEWVWFAEVVSWVILGRVLEWYFFSAPSAQAYFDSVHMSRSRSGS